MVGLGNTGKSVGKLGLEAERVSGSTLTKAEVGTDGLVQIAVCRTCGVTEVHIVRALQHALSKLKVANQNERVMFTMSHGKFGRWCARTLAKFVRYTNTSFRYTNQLRKEVQEMAEEATRALVEEAEKLTEESLAMAGGVAGHVVGDVGGLINQLAEQSGYQAQCFSHGSNIYITVHSY